MNAHSALTLLQQALVDHKLTDWTAAMDNARRRFGVCRMSKKQISLSRHLCELNSDAEVLDTILHEIAHALAWERHGENCGHDQRWKAICVEIGARPETCFDNEVVQPKAPWVLVNKDSGEVYRSYYKRPSRDWSQVWIRGRKKQTYGKLEVRANTQAPETGDLFAQTTDTQNPAHLAATEKPAAIREFDTRTVTEFKAKLLEHIENLSDEFGLKVTNSKGRYSTNSCDLTLTFTIPAGDNDADLQRIEFENLAGLFNLKASHYLHRFNVNGRSFRLIGIKPNNRRYPVIGIDDTDRRFKFEQSVLEQIVE